MSAFLADLRQGARLLVRTPAFASVAIAALAIGIGANTAIFSVVNTLLIQPLPYGEAERVAVVWEHNLPRDRKSNVVSPANYLHWRDMNAVFDDIAATGPVFSMTLTGLGDPVEIPYQLVTANFFPVLGVQPALGRPFTEDEAQPGSNFVVVSHRFWRTRLNADPAAPGRAITLQGQSYTITGVMPPAFSFLDTSVDLWVSLGLPPEARTPRGRSLTTVARLKPGVTFEQAQRDMTRVADELTRQFPSFNTGWTARVVPIREELTGDVKPALLIMLGAVGFVLLIACANVANLLLARATVRRRELAVRAALGAGRGRIARQLFAESLVLAAVSGAAGVLLAWWGLGLFRTVVAERLPIQRLDSVGLDMGVLAFTGVATLVSGLLFGLVPAVTASGAALTDALKDGGRTGSAGTGTRTRSAFVVVEVALALVLLVGAGLLVRSFARLMDVDTGFHAAETLTMKVSIPQVRYLDASQRAAFYDTFLERISTLPGVQSAGAVSFLPLNGLGAATGYTVIGDPVPAAGQEPVADIRLVAGDYFAAMGIPLVRGQLFDDWRSLTSLNRVVVNESLARAHWPGEDPIGKRLRVSWEGGVEAEIIGVVGDVRMYALEDPNRAAIYWPYVRTPYTTMTVAVRAVGNPGALVSGVREVLRQQDPELALSDVRPMADVVSRSVTQRRLTMTMLAVFAIAALVLAAVGIYGVIAYSVTQRTQEIGIRVALGARSGDVLRLVVGQAVKLAAAGILLGGLGALLLSRLMRDLLFEVQPFDPLTFFAVAGVLAIVAALASYLPGYRATRVDPIIALRAE